jgi:hypothetical protein
MGRYLVAVAALLFAACAARTGIDDFPGSSEEVNFPKIEKNCSTRSKAAWDPMVKFEYAFSVPDSGLDEIHSGMLIALRHHGYSVIIDDPVNQAIIGVRGAWMNDVRSIAGVYFKKIDTVLHIYVKIEVDQDIPGSWRSNRAEEICMSICNQLHAPRR